jgi:acetolactate synthase-1/2/3 large subunit
MNGAAIIAEILKREGTEFLSCYPRNSLIEACAELDIRPILCRQERVGVGMADGYSRIKQGRRNGVFAAQAGPGIENLFPASPGLHRERADADHSGGAAAERQYAAGVSRRRRLSPCQMVALAHSVQELPT